MIDLAALSRQGRLGTRNIPKKFHSRILRYNHVEVMRRYPWLEGRPEMLTEMLLDEPQYQIVEQNDPPPPNAASVPTSNVRLNAGIAAEFGGSGQIRLKDYYGAHPDVPTSGAIRILDFAGLSDTVLPDIDLRGSSSEFTTAIAVTQKGWTQNGATLSTSFTQSQVAYDDAKSPAVISNTDLRHTVTLSSGATYTITVSHKAQFTNTGTYAASATDTSRSTGGVARTATSYATQSFNISGVASSSFYIYTRSAGAGANAQYQSRNQQFVLTVA